MRATKPLDNAMTDTLPVFRVSRQIPGQDSLLVEESPEQKRRHRGEREEAPVRAKCEQRAERVERSARVHRMAHDGVRSCRNDLLAGGDFDRGGRESVLAIDEENEIEADRHEDVAQHDGPDGNVGPPEAMIECGHDEERDESPWISARPKRGLARLIRRISSRSSISIPGRPRRHRLFHAQ